MTTYNVAPWWCCLSVRSSIIGIFYVYRCIRWSSLFVVAVGCICILYIYMYVLPASTTYVLICIYIYSLSVLVDSISVPFDPTPPKSQNYIFQSVLLTRARARRPQTLGFGHLEGSKWPLWDPKICHFIYGLLTNGPQNRALCVIITAYWTLIWSIWGDL